MLLGALAWVAPAAGQALPAPAPEAEAPLEAFRSELQARLDGLAAVAGDYAHWNDAWQFATGARARFPGEGLLAPALARVGVRQMLLLDRRLNTRLSLQIGSASQMPGTVAPDPVLLAVLREAASAGRLASRTDTLQGLANVAGTPSLVVARPVLRESGNGAPGGWLAFAQPLSGETLDILMRLLGPSAQAFDRQALEAGDLLSGIRARLDVAASWGEVFSRVDGSRVESWLALRAFDGQPLWAVRLESDLPAAPEPLAAGHTATTLATPAPGEGFAPGNAGLVSTVLIAAALLLALGMWRGRRRIAATPRTPPAPARAVQARPAPVPAPPVAAAPVKVVRAKPAPAPDIIEIAPDGVLVVLVEDGKILRANPAARRLFGLSESELRTQRVDQLLRSPPEDGPAPGAGLPLGAATQHVRRVLLDASGTLRDVEASVVPLDDSPPRSAAVFLREAGPQAVERAVTRVNAAQLSVHYQPIIDLESERVCGLEALPLWKDTLHGWIHPDDPLCVAAEGGAAHSIGRYVLGVVARDLALWRSQGASPVPVNINVAVTPRDRDDFGTALRDILAQHDGARDLLRLEISDEALRDPRSGLFRADALERWQELGLPIVVDRFGTRSRPATVVDPAGVGALKLDPDLVRDVATDAPERGTAEVETIISRARARGLAVIAEGVDRWPQMAALRALGCHQVQGPLFSRAVDAAQAMRFLRDERLVLIKQDPLEATDELPALRLIKP